MLNKTLTVIFVLSSVLMGDLWVRNQQILAGTREVTITSDKTEYVPGDTVAISVRNGLDTSIWSSFQYCGGRPFWELQEFTGGVWEYCDSCLPLKNAGGTCVLTACERQEPQELKRESEIKDAWHITSFCEFIDEKGVLLEKPRERIIKKGIYRLKFRYAFDKGSMHDKFSYSNEFRIK